MQDEELENDALVVLGFAEELEHGSEPDFTTSRVGGQVRWGEPEPPHVDLACGECGKDMAFLLQLYCPDNMAHAFHRILYLFICRTESCNRPSARRAIRALRRQFADADGLFGSSSSGPASWPEFEIVSEPEPPEETPADGAVIQHAFGPNAIPDSEEAYETIGNGDAAFLEFQRRLEREPEQVLRYTRNKDDPTGHIPSPLWISERNRLNSTDVPPCACGAARELEMQVLPTLLNELAEDVLDWGVLNVYTCSQSCSLANKDYQQEFVWRQDVAQ